MEEMAALWGQNFKSSHSPGGENREMRANERNDRTPSAEMREMGTLNGWEMKEMADRRSRNGNKLRHLRE